MIKPLSVEPAVLKFEMPYMLVFSMVLIPLIWHKNGLGRRRGVVLLAGYLLFIGLMFIREPV